MVDNSSADLEPTGPFIAAAILCERLLQDKDGVYSAIRIVDRITHTARGPNPPDEMPPLPVRLSAFIALKAGQAKGRHTVSLRIEDPRGVRQELAKTGVMFDAGEGRGVNVVADLDLTLEHEGLYWIDVLLGDSLITRIPLHLAYQPVQTPSA